MPTIIIVAAALAVVRYAISAVIVIFAVNKTGNVSAGFGSKRFHFTLNVTERMGGKNRHD